ncbi:ATP-binding protein [Pseudooceanicola sp. MF1-13]|uniref:ATP-binding protein n=1 Tax=Pseudooceanicola sp. MF1-13 TaxID=3379095 RepID=UPI00389235E1
MDHRKELDRLYKMEYGEPLEFAFRCVLVLTGAIIHFQYTGMTTALFWCLGFFLSHALYFMTLRTRPEYCTEFDTLKAGSVFLVMLAAFVWWPASLITQDDIALRISGTAGTGTLLVFLINRSDSLKWMVYGEIAIIFAAVGLIIAVEMVAVDNAAARWVMGFSGLALVAYFSRTLLAARTQRLETEAASVRSVQAQKMEAVGQLAGGVAHDFNNILTAVTGNLELYEVIDDPKERDQFVAEARLAADRAATLVGHLLAYSRKSTLSLSTFPVGRVFDQVNTLSARLLPSSIDLSFDSEDASQPIRVDQNQLMTALINLIVNARDAMGRSGTLAIRSRACAFEEPTALLDGSMLDPGCYVEIAVTDNGPGIPAHILRKVTEPFFTTKEIGEGSGLGLSMVEGFARQSKGGLMIDTSPDGTTIRMYLPSPIACERAVEVDNTVVNAVPAAA